MIAEQEGVRMYKPFADLKVSPNATFGALVLLAVLVAGCARSPADTADPPESATLTASATSSDAGVASQAGSAHSETAAPSCLAKVCIAPGAFTTSDFLDGGLTVTFGDPWESNEDQTAEFSAAPVGTSDQHRLLFWMDILPVDPNSFSAAVDVPPSAAELINWLSQRPNITVTNAGSTTIGAANLPAKTVDITVAPDAAKEDPGCPALACAAFLTWPNSNGNIYTIATPAVTRLLLSDVVLGGSSHLLAVAIEAKDHADLEAFAPVATAVIGSATAPLTHGQ